MHFRSQSSFSSSYPHCPMLVSSKKEVCRETSHSDEERLYRQKRRWRS
uniref:Uncharacterized protein n=1 Tax=Cucumis melo TaxID=3656 RepID=A0A9I9E9D2_CUCME